MKRPVAIVTLGLIGASPSLGAQRAPELVFQGVQAYQRLDLDAAAAMFRAALATDSTRPGAVRLSTDQQVRALTYLGATELFRKRLDAARQAFRSALALDPTARPDPRLFPPQVSELFDWVRGSTSMVEIAIAPVTRFRARAEYLPVQLTARGPAARAWFRLEREDGTPVRVLFDGVMSDGDSLMLRWDGLDGASAAVGTAPVVPAGRYRLTLTTQQVPSDAVRTVRVPITVERATTAAPRSAPQDEQRKTHHAFAWRMLIVGATAATAAVALPRAISPDVDNRSRRLIVPIAIGTAGLVGFLTGNHGRRPPLPVTSPATRPVSPAAAAPRDAVTLIVRAGAAVPP